MSEEMLSRVQATRVSPLSPHQAKRTSISFVDNNSTSTNESKLENGTLVRVQIIPEYPEVIAPMWLHEDTRPVTPSSTSSAAPSASASASSLSSIVGIQNPFFANGLDGWDIATRSGGTYSVTPSTDCGDGVATCVSLYTFSSNPSSSRNAAVYQDSIPVVDGQQYTISYGYRITSLDSGIMGVYLYGLPTGGTLSGTANVWYTYNDAFTASGSTVSIAPFQRSYVNSKTIQVTDVKLVTCPATITES